MTRHEMPVGAGHATPGNDEGSAVRTQTPQEQTKADPSIVADHGTAGKQRNPAKLAAQINAEHAAARADAQAAMQRMQCPECAAHAYIPMKAALDGYVVACCDCDRRMEPVDRARRAGI